MKNHETYFTLPFTIFFLTEQGLGSVQEGGDFLSLQRRLVEIFEENKNAIARIKSVFPKTAESSRTQVTFSTGFFISRAGHVLTTANSTANAHQIWVEYQGIDYLADLLGSDRYTNLALLQVTHPPEDFSFLHLTDSPDLPPVGTMLVRISALFEFSPSPNIALVSGIESQIGLNIFRVPYIRTTLRAGPGEGGAPLLDLNGRLVGITIAALPPELESSYVLPARAALRIRDDLLFSGKVTYGWIGFEVKEQISREEGLQILLREIIPETPAEKAGLLTGDVLLQIDDYEIKSVSDVSRAIFYTREGQFVTVKVQREEEQMALTVRVAPRPADEPFTEPMLSDQKIPPPEASEDSPRVADVSGKVTTQKQESHEERFAESKSSEEANPEPELQTTAFSE